MNTAKIKGRLIKTFDQQFKSGKSVLCIVVEQQLGRYPSHVMAKCPRIGDFARGLHLGDEVEIVGRIESRAWQDRYFTDLIADEIRILGDGGKAPTQGSIPPADETDVPF